MSNRNPDDVLAQLEGQLSDAFIRNAKVNRPSAKWQKLAIAAVGTALFLTSSAAATRSFWAPKQPEVSNVNSSHNEPSTTNHPIYIAGDKSWQLSFTSCQYDKDTKIGLFLSLPNGNGGGTRCDLGPESGVEAHSHRLQRYYDSTSKQTWFFTTVPDSTSKLIATVTTKGKANQTLQVPPRSLNEGVEKFPFLKQTAVIIFSTNGLSTIEKERLVYN